MNETSGSHPPVVLTVPIRVPLLYAPASCTSEEGLARETTDSGRMGFRGSILSLSRVLFPLQNEVSEVRLTEKVAIPNSCGTKRRHIRSVMKSAPIPDSSVPENSVNTSAH